MSRNLAKEVMSSSWIKVVGSRGDFKEIKASTALVYPEELSHNSCQLLVSKIDEILAEENHPRVWCDDHGSDKRILGFEKDIKELDLLLGIKEKIKAIDEYLGRRTKSWFIMANRVVAKSGGLGSGGGWHRDSPYSHQVKCIWYLNDVGRDCGPFQYIPGTHFNNVRGKSVYEIGKTRFEKVYDTPVQVVAAAGTLLVCDTKCIHRGKPVEKGVRYAVTLYTSPKINGAKEIFRKNNINPELIG